MATQPVADTYNSDIVNGCMIFPVYSRVEVTDTKVCIILMFCPSTTSFLRAYAI